MESKEKSEVHLNYPDSMNSSGSVVGVVQSARTSCNSLMQRSEWKTAFQLNAKFGGGQQVDVLSPTHENTTIDQQGTRSHQDISSLNVELDVGGRKSLSKLQHPGNACGDYINTVGVQDVQLSKMGVRFFSESNVPAEVLEFSDISNPSAIKSRCIANVPGWKDLSHEDLVIDQQCEGLTNQLFKVFLNEEEDSETLCDTSYRCVLFRIYGKQVSQFYDPSIEMKVFRMLSGYQIGPSLLGYGEGWRIEEWHFSIVVPTRLLPNPSIYCQVASSLGRFHKLHQRPDFPHNEGFIREASVNLWLEKWSAQALQVTFSDPMQQKALARLNLPRMTSEVGFLRDALKTKNSYITGQGYDVVFCHNDCQENNLLQTQYGLRMIDFEYAHFNYQAYDIANFFNEFMIDYISKSYPFFTVNLKNYPSENAQRMFCAVYLSEYLETPVSVDDAMFIDPLLDAINFFGMVSHILWGFWSVMRAPQAMTFDEFDFLAHAQFRFDQFIRMKEMREKLGVKGSLRNSGIRNDSMVSRCFSCLSNDPALQNVAQAGPPGNSGLQTPMYTYVPPSVTSVPPAKENNLSSVLIAVLASCVTALILSPSLKK